MHTFSAPTVSMLKSSVRLAAFAATIGSITGLLHATPADLYWRTDGTSGTWTSTGWNLNSATSTGGTGWTATDNAFFTADSTLTYVTGTLFGNLTVSDGKTVTVTQAGTASAAAHIYDIGTGATLSWGGQNYTANGTSFVKNGAGIWNIGAIGNAYNGGFTLNSGMVIVSGNNSLGAGSLTINGGTISASGGKTFAPTSITVGGDFTFAGTGNETFTGPISLGSAVRTVTNSQTSGTLILSGTISGGSGGGLSFAGTGATTLTGANTYSGGTTVSGGALTLSGGDNRLSSSGAITVSGGTLDLSTTNQSAGAVSLSSGSITGAGSLTGSSYAVSGGSISAKLAGSGAMTVSGSASLSGDNSGWSGNTTINSGTLTAGHSSALGTGLVTVNGGILDIGAHTIGNGIALSGGTLTGSGGSFTGTVTMNSASSVSGSLILTSLAINSWNGTTALTAASGSTLSIGTLNLDVGTLAGFHTGTSMSWTVINGSLASSVSLTTLHLTGTSGYTGGTFSGALSGGDYTVTYSAVPEPATYAAIAGGLALLGAMVYRRRARRVALPVAAA